MTFSTRVCGCSPPRDHRNQSPPATMAMRIIQRRSGRLRFVLLFLISIPYRQRSVDFQSRLAAQPNKKTICRMGRALYSRACHAAKPEILQPRYQLPHCSGGHDGCWQIDCGTAARCAAWLAFRSEEHTSELQSLMRISYAVFCLKKKN